MAQYIEKNIRQKVFVVMFLKICDWTGSWRKSRHFGILNLCTIGCQSGHHLVQFLIPSYGE